MSRQGVGKLLSRLEDMVYLSWRYSRIFECHDLAAAANDFVRIEENNPRFNYSMFCQNVPCIIFYVGLGDMKLPG
jgi:hypothetical protein